MIVGVLLALLTACLAIGMPISHAMGLSAVLALALEGDIPLLLLAQRFYDALDSFPLLAVPLFVVAGELMNVAGITERLVGLSRALEHLRSHGHRDAVPRYTTGAARGHPGLESALSLGIIVLVRTFLSFSLEIELEGVVPWHRAARSDTQGATTEPIGENELHPSG